MKPYVGQTRKLTSIRYIGKLEVLIRFWAIISGLGIYVRYLQGVITFETYMIIVVPLCIGMAIYNYLQD